MTLSVRKSFVWFVIQALLLVSSLISEAYLFSLVIYPVSRKEQLGISHLGI